jgi:hypothetical protein
MRAFVKLDELVACRAICILQTDSKSVWVIIRTCGVVLIPLLCDPLLDAFEMENMLAAKLDDCFFSEALDIADDAVGISVFSECIRLIFGNTIFVKARWMFGLMSIPIAGMTAFKELSTAPVSLLFALSLRADILPRVFQGSLTKPALLHVLLFLKLCTSLPDMIGFDFAADAEVIPTLIAAHAVGAHVSRSRLVNVLAFLILIVVVNLTLHEFDGVATLASEDAVVLI